jgi:uncharacterized protein
MIFLAQIDDFLKQNKIAIAGVSRQKGKFGNSIYKGLKRKGYDVIPLNPKMDLFAGDKCYHTVSELPVDTTALLINTKPDKVIPLITEAMNRSITRIWVQQGAESQELLDFAKEKQIDLITGECIFMYASPVGFMHRIHRYFHKKKGKYPS